MNRFDASNTYSTTDIESKRNSNVLQAVFNMIKSEIGVIVIAVPYAFSYSGVIGGILGILVIIMINGKTVIMQSKAVEKRDPNIRSLSELGFKVLGPVSKSIIDTFII